MAAAAAANAIAPAATMERDDEADGIMVGAIAGASVCIGSIVVTSRAPSGMRTASMTWTIPLLARMSVATIPAPLTVGAPPSKLKVMTSPWRVSNSKPSVMAEAGAIPSTTWYVNNVEMRSAGSSVVPKASVAAAMAAVNASLVGAKTVNGPPVLNVSASPALVTKLTNVDRSGVATARSTIELDTHDGNKTVSTTWISPLSAVTSGVTTVETSLMTTLSPTRAAVMSSPFNVVASTLPASMMAEAGTSAARTWYPSTFWRWSFHSSVIKLATTSAGNASKASLTGAKTVRGSPVDNASARSAWTTKSTSVENASSL
mmetsp:Transcript_23247/g.55110  ORF Transcript_23247/g.55110 Transcript_23247/m.55110 type:complete len:317 (+) Transcript_23247:180-1130(+)